MKSLYKNSRENIVNIATDNKTTLDKVKHRMKKLYDQRIIVRYIAKIDYQKLGYEFYKSLIYLKNFNSENLKKMIEYTENSKTILNVVQQVAPWDLEFVIFARSFQEYSSAISEFTQKFPNMIKKIETATMGEDLIYPSNKLVFE